MPADDPFEIYARGLISNGYDRDCIRRNEPVLRQRFARDEMPLRRILPPEPETRDRYEEL